MLRAYNQLPQRYSQFLSASALVRAPLYSLVLRIMLRIVLRISNCQVDTLRQRLVELRIVLSINNLSVSFQITAGLRSNIDFLSPF